MTKKLVSLLIAVFFGVLSLGAAMLMALFITEYQNGSPEGTGLLGLSALMLFMIAVCAVIVQVSNRTYDEAEGYRNNNAKIRRWTKTMLFGDLLMVLMGVLLLVSIDDKGNILYPERLVIILFAACAAIMIYLFAMAKYIKRRKRISELKYRDSLCYGRRFNFIVTSREGIDVYGGYVQGKIMTNDSAWAIGSLADADNPVAAKIKKIWIDDKEVHSAKDQTVKIQIECSQTVYLYAVLSSHLPKYQTEPIMTAENPRVSGMLSCLKDCFDDPLFIPTMNYDIVQGNYLLAAHVGERRGYGKDIMDTLDENTSVSFYSVTMAGKPEELTLPVFTDWEALGRYGYAIEDPNTAVIALDFEKCVEVMRRGYNGIVINPFGPFSFCLPEEFAEELAQFKMSLKEKKDEPTV